jgi:hypothetical protein
VRKQLSKVIALSAVPFLVVSSWLLSAAAYVRGKPKGSA